MSAGRLATIHSRLALRKRPSLADGRWLVQELQAAQVAAGQSREEAQQIALLQGMLGERDAELRAVLAACSNAGLVAVGHYRETGQHAWGYSWHDAPPAGSYPTAAEAFAAGLAARLGTPPQDTREQVRAAGELPLRSEEGEL